MSEEDRAAALSQPSHLKVDAAARLGQVVEPHLNLCYWRRRCSTELAASLDALARERPFSQVLDSWRDQIDTAELVAQVCELPSSLQAEWALDIAQLLHLFCEIAGTQRVVLKLASTTRTDCPVFHTDYVPLRLLCAYAGSGMEFVDDHNVRRSLLGRAHGRPAQEVNQDILIDPRRIERLHRFDVALCKGALHPECRGRGLVHRSPKLTPSSPARIKLTIDAVGV